MLPLTAMAQRGWQVRKDVPLDSIRLSDPAVLADQKTQMYYMTGTGGMMWRSSRVSTGQLRTLTASSVHE